MTPTGSEGEGKRLTAHPTNRHSAPLDPPRGRPRIGVPCSARPHPGRVSNPLRSPYYQEENDLTPGGSKAGLYMARKESKTIALTVASGVLTFGVQQLSAGQLTMGAVGSIIGLLLFAVYQLAEEADHGEAYNDIVATIGEENFKRLSEMGAAELDSLIEDNRGG